MAASGIPETCTGGDSQAVMLTLYGDLIHTRTEASGLPSPNEEQQPTLPFSHVQPMEETSQQFHDFPGSTDERASTPSSLRDDASARETDEGNGSDFPYGQQETCDARQPLITDSASQNTKISESHQTRNGSCKRYAKCACIFSILLIFTIILILSVCVLFITLYPTKDVMAIGGNTSISLVPHGFSSLLTGAVEVMLGENPPPTSFFVTECNQVKTSTVSLPQKPATVQEEDEFDTFVPLNYFGTDLPLYSAGPVQIVYTISANSTVPYSSAGTCPLQLFLFDENSTYQQSLSDSKLSGNINQSACLLSLSKGNYYSNQTSQTIFATDQKQPRFYFVLAYIRKGVHMTFKIEVKKLTTYNTNDLSPQSCTYDTVPIKCRFEVSNSTIDSSVRKWCIFAKSVDAVTPPYFLVTTSSILNIMASIVVVFVPAAFIFSTPLCVAVGIYCFRKNRQTPAT